MEIRELKYFVQVAKDGNYSTAAQKLYISQPALSKVIHKLEEEMGFEFFTPFKSAKPDGFRAGVLRKGCAGN